MDSVPKTSHAELTAYMDNVVQRAVQNGLLSSDRGTSARFAELLGPEVSRQIVWHWLVVQGGIPRNRINQLRRLNESLGIVMSDEELETILQSKVAKGDASPAQVLFDEVEKSAIERNMQGNVVRQQIADIMGVSARTLFRYRVGSGIPAQKKPKLKEAIDTLNIRVPADVMAAVFD